MGRFKSLVNDLGKVADAMYERHQEIDEMTREIVKRTHGVDLTEAKKIATMLVNQAEVTWK